MYWAKKKKTALSQCLELKMSPVRRMFSFFGDCVLICITSTTWGQRGVKKPDVTQQTSLELLFLTSLYMLTKYWPLVFVFFYCQLHKDDFFFFQSKALMPWKADYFCCYCYRLKHCKSRIPLSETNVEKWGKIEKWKMRRRRRAKPPHTALNQCQEQNWFIQDACLFPETGKDEKLPYAA